MGLASEASPFITPLWNILSVKSGVILNSRAMDKTGFEVHIGGRGRDDEEMTTWCHGTMETWRHGDMEIWSHGDIMET